MTREQVKGHIAIFIATIIFGLNGPFTSALVGTGTIHPWVHMSFRFGISAALFWVVSFFIKSKEIEWRDLVLLLGAALTGVVFNQGGFAFAMSMTTSIRQSLMATLAPIFTMLLAALFLKEPITKKKVLGVLIGCSGVLLLMFSGNKGEIGSGSKEVTGMFLALFATFNYTLYLTLFRDIIVKYSPIVLMKWLFLFSFIIVIPFSYQPILETEWSLLTTQEIGMFAFIIFFSTFVAYFLLPIGLKSLRPTVIAMYNYISPIITTLVALAMGLEGFDMVKLVAGVLILLGVYTVNRSKSRADILQEQSSSSAETKIGSASLMKSHTEPTL